jgi:hypothetical protein
MPVGRYVAWVGTLLLALLLVADWFVPKLAPEPPASTINMPVIRIASIQQPPERIIIDTSQPTLVPPPTLVGDVVPGEQKPLQSYASASPPPTTIDVIKRRKAIKREGPKVAAKQPSFARVPSVANGNSWTTNPLTKLSFTDIVSGQLVRNLLNLR